MPYAPAIKVTGGSMVFIAGVTAAPVYHSNPHKPEEFASMPMDMEGQAIGTMENLKKSLDALGATFANVVVANRFLTDLSQQDILNKVG
jgi:2-iminobutanoate/2-iminopropanoate deaminase